MLSSNVAPTSFPPCASTTDVSNGVGGRSKFKDVGEVGGREARHMEPPSLKLHSLVYLCCLRSGGTEQESLPAAADEFNTPSEEEGKGEAPGA